MGQMVDGAGSVLPTNTVTHYLGIWVHAIFSTMNVSWANYF